MGLLSADLKDQNLAKRGARYEKNFLLAGGATLTVTHNLGVTPIVKVFTAAGVELEDTSITSVTHDLVTRNSVVVVLGAAADVRVVCIG